MGSEMCIRDSLATYADRVFHISDGKIIKIENHRKNEANKEEKKNE